MFGENITRNSGDPKWICSPTCEEKIFTEIEKIHAVEILSSNNGKSNTIENIANLLETFNFEVNREIQNLKNMIKEVIKAQEFSSGKLDDIMKEFDDLKSSNIKLKTEVDTLKLENGELREDVFRLESLIDIPNQQQFQNDIILAGLPIEEISAKQITEQFCDKYGLGKYEDVVHSSQYIQPPSYNNNRNQVRRKQNLLLIRFDTGSTKDMLYNKRKGNKFLAASEIGFRKAEHKDEPIYVREHLTQYQRMLYKEMIEIKHQHNFKYMWVRDSTIFFRKADDSKIYKIKSRTDVLKFKTSYFRNE